MVRDPVKLVLLALKLSYCYYTFYVYSHCSDGEEEAGNDWLFIVIADIITAHNAMLDLPRQLASQPFIRLLPNKQTEAFPNEITATHSIVPQSEK